MSMQIEELSWLDRLLTGYRYRVTDVEIEVDDESYSHPREFTINKFFEHRNSDNWKYQSHLKPVYRKWLETSLTYGTWKAEHPKYKGGFKELGILFKKKSDIVMFKLAHG